MPGRPEQLSAARALRWSETANLHSQEVSPLSKKVRTYSRRAIWYDLADFQSVYCETLRRPLVEWVLLEFGGRGVFGHSRSEMRALTAADEIAVASVGAAPQRELSVCLTKDSQPYSPSWWDRPAHSFQKSCESGIAVGWPAFTCQEKRLLLSPFTCQEKDGRSVHLLSQDQVERLFVAFRFS